MDVLCGLSCNVSFLSLKRRRRKVYIRLVLYILSVFNLTQIITTIHKKL